MFREMYSQYIDGDASAKSLAEKSFPLTTGVAMVEGEGYRVKGRKSPNGAQRRKLRAKL